MVDINLIPTILRKDGKGKSGAAAINIDSDILLGVTSGAVILIILGQLILGLIWGFEFWQLSSHQAQWQVVMPDKAAIDSINNESKDLKKKIGMIQDMTVKKSVLWAPKFNAISDALPRGLWIKKMTLDKAGLSLEGSVVSKTANEINNVGLFISALKENNDFIKDFASLEVNSIERGKANAIDVTDFTVMAKSK